MTRVRSNYLKYELSDDLEPIETRLRVPPNIEMVLREADKNVVSLQTAQKVMLTYFVNGWNNTIIVLFYYTMIGLLDLDKIFASKG